MKNIIAIFFTSMIFHTSFSQDVSLMYNRVIKSVVTINTGNSLGSGFFVSENIIATNYHVVEGSSSATCHLLNSNTEYIIEGYVAVDKQADLILLKVKGLNRDAIKVKKEDVKVGSQVYAIGSPEGMEGTITDGLVSSKRDLNGKKLVQISAPISHGSSGGPVVDINGELIGVSVSRHKDGQNLNFAIPVSYLNLLLEYKRIESFPLVNLNFESNDYYSSTSSDFGEVIFYMNEKDLGEVFIFVGFKEGDERFVGSLKEYFTNSDYAPDCSNKDGTILISLPVGTYYLKATNKSKTLFWDFNFAIKANDCRKVRLWANKKETNSSTKVSSSGKVYKKAIIPNDIGSGSDDCFLNLQKAFDDRGAYNIPDEMHRNVIISFIEEGGAFCIAGKARIENGVIVSIFLQYSDMTYEFMEKKFYNSKKSLPIIVNGISEMITNSDGEKFKVVFIDALKPPLKGYRAAELPYAIRRNGGDCFLNLQKAFDDRGAYNIPDEMHRNVIISFIEEGGAFCIAGKARIENGVIVSIFLQYSDMTYEFMEKKFYNSKKSLPIIVNGISEMITNSDGEKFKVVFIDALK